MFKAVLCQSLLCLLPNSLTLPVAINVNFFNQRLNNADTKTFWKTLRLLNHDYSPILTLLDGDGSNTVESSSAKAACLNSFFYTCFNHNYPPLTDAAQDLDFTYGSLCPSHCPAQLLCTEESVLELDWIYPNLQAAMESLQRC